MNDSQFARIEEYLGEPVPRRYREIMAEYPLDAKDWNSPLALPDDPNQILLLNDMMRHGEFAADWPPRRFVIGSSPCGDSYYLDLTGASPAVFVKYHDADDDLVEASDLDGFVSLLKGWEREAADRKPKPRRSWWPFVRARDA